MHRRIDVAEIPFVGGNLAGRMEVEALQQQIELLLREVDIDDGERDGLEGEIPGGEPGIFPLVGHRDDVLVQHVRPVAVSHRRRARFARIDAMLLQPFPDIEEIVLLGPQHPGQGLPHHVRRVGADPGRRQAAVERIGFAPARREDIGEAVEGIAGRFRRCIGQAQADDGSLPGAHRHLVVRGRLGPDLLRIDRVLLARRDEVVDAVLDVGGRVGRAEEALIVRLVLGEEQRRAAFAMQVIGSDLGFGRRDDAVARRRGVDFQGRPGRVGPPAPDVAEPQRGQEMKRGRVRPPIADADLDQDVGRPLLGIFDDDVEVAIVLEDAGIEQLVLHVLAATPTVRGDQVVVGVGLLRILVEELHVRMGGRAIEVEVVLLHVLAVIALAVGQAEHALLEDRVLAVPERQGKAETLPVVAQAGDAVLAPVIGARSRLIVGEVVPGVAVLAVVLPDRAPLPFAEIRPPLLPGDSAAPCFFQARLLRRRGLRFCVAVSHGRSISRRLRRMNCTISRASVNRIAATSVGGAPGADDWPDQDAATILLAAEARMPRPSKTG